MHKLDMIPMAGVPSGKSYRRLSYSFNLIKQYKDKNLTYQFKLKKIKNCLKHNHQMACIRTAI